MGLLIIAWTYGLILAILALGVFISYRIFRMPDLTADGSITLGAAVAAVLLTTQFNPFLAMLIAFAAGMAAGSVTGVLYTKFKLDSLLAGIIVMTGLYSVNLRIMGKSNLPLGDATTLATYSSRLSAWWFGEQARLRFFRWEIEAAQLTFLVLTLGTICLIAVGLYAFFRTELGTAMRATGDNDQMIKALGVDVDRMRIVGSALSNGLVALSGALLVQAQGFSDVQMGIGQIVVGLASVIIGETLVGGQHHLGLALIGTVMGSVLFRLLTALVLQAGGDPNDMKLYTAIILFVALVAPTYLAKLRGRRGSVKHA